ncbi:hypothetical protein RDWZM_004736 [Blomia tropicalis]|uniref:Uncharacterized protein n=1 Tax=Blomia tropicalis TaxID=40697 RepID=A0A9Q0M4V5_BLOTA|nr:hypothetical protein RDWZM_004736 [Blomia tropicalis]
MGMSDQKTKITIEARCLGVEYMVVDFSHQDIYGEIEERLKQLNGPIHVLVNNVGMMFNIPEYFIKYPKDFNLKLINTNIVSITMMCQIVMPIMMEQKRRIKTNDRGIIINIGSAAGLTEFPFFSTYSASKAYITYFSKILSYEYEQDGIIIQTVTPNQVDTKLAANVQVPNLSTTPQSFVSYALKTVANERFTNGHPKHKLINNLSKFIGDLLGNHLYMNFKFRIIQNEMNLIKNANRKTKLISIDDDKIFD